MEYCGGGSIRDLSQILQRPLSEPQIAVVCRETLQVSISAAHSTPGAVTSVGSRILAFDRKDPPRYQGRKHPGDSKRRDQVGYVHSLQKWWCRIHRQMQPISECPRSWKEPSRNGIHLQGPRIGNSAMSVHPCAYRGRMAPEVIQENQYDGKVPLLRTDGFPDGVIFPTQQADIWSLGITAIEMAQLLPPNASVHPMRVLFKILRDPSPTLSRENGVHWSPMMHDFVAQCLVKDPQLRPTADMLLEVCTGCFLR